MYDCPENEFMFSTSENLDEEERDLIMELAPLVL